MRLSGSVARRFLYIAIPAAEQPGAGVVRVAADLSVIDRQAGALRRGLLVVGLGALVVVLPLALLFSHLALRPLRQIAEVVGSIAQGDLDQRLPRGSSDEIGRIAAAVNAMADQLRARLRELTEDKERLQAVLAGMVEGVLVVDAEQRVVLANPPLRELLGFRGDAVGRPHWEVVRRADVQEAIAKAAAQPGAIVGDVSTEGPEPRHLQLHAVRFPAAGPLLGVVAVLHDVTEIRRLEGMRRDFVTNVSHELKTPLTAIRGFAETLRGSDVPPAQQKAYLDVILRHAERLARLIEDILVLSRVEGRQQPFTPGAVDVARAATVLLRDMHPQFEARRIRAEVAPSARGVAYADRRAVEQILSNLLDNASKYTEEGGRIEVRVGEAGGQIRLEVEDDGIGIPAAGPAARLRALLPGRQGALPRPRRHRAGARHREAPRAGPGRGGLRAVRPGRGLDLRGAPAQERLSGGGERDAIATNFASFVTRASPSRPSLPSSSPSGHRRRGPPAIRPGEGAGHSEGKGMRRVWIWAGAAVLAAACAAPAARAGDPEPVIEDVLQILKDRGIVDDGQYNELVAKQQTWEAKNSPLLGRIEFSGDMRLRYENFWYDEDAFGVDRSNRNRLRYRLRLLGKVAVNEYVDAIFRLGSGENDQRSNNRTLGFDNDFGPDSLFIDQAYLALKAPKDWLAGASATVIGGKVANPFLANWKSGKCDLLWDADINPEGVGAQLTYKPGETLNLFANAGYFIDKENSTSTDPHVFGIQGGLVWNAADTVELGARLAYYSWASLDNGFFTRASAIRA